MVQPHDQYQQSQHFHEGGEAKVHVRDFLTTATLANPTSTASAVEKLASNLCAPARFDFQLFRCMHVILRQKSSCAQPPVLELEYNLAHSVCPQHCNNPQHSKCLHESN
eukprot:4450880-Amphidinium_carterae.2